MAVKQNVEFQTLDKITLRGDLYLPLARGPGIVMCPGVSTKTSSKFPVSVEL